MSNSILVGEFSDTTRFVALSVQDNAFVGPINEVWEGEPIGFHAEQEETTLSDIDNCAVCGVEIYEHDFGARIWFNEVAGKTVHRCS